MNSRRLALNVLQRVEDGDLLNLSFASEVESVALSARDRHLAQELSYGVTRYRMRYDSYIAELAREPISHPLLQNILRLGLHQLFALRLADHAAINETVELSKLVGLGSKSGFVNAILRSAQREGEGSLSERALVGVSQAHRMAIGQSHPEWVVSELHESLIRCGAGDQLQDLLQHNNSIAPIQLAVRDSSALEMLQHNSSTEATAVPGCFQLNQSFGPELLNSGVWVQDLGSQAVTRAFQLAIPANPSRVIDACAAPGGKSRLLRALLPPNTNLISIDISAQRLQKVEQVAHGENWKVEVADFIHYRGEPADAILIDAPCSSLGSVRRKPDTKYRSIRNQLGAYQVTQAALIEAGWHNLRPGGVLAYVTCTPTVAETDRVIRQAIPRGWHKLDTSASLLGVSSKLDVCARPNGAAMLWGHRNHSDTMFMSLLRKPEA